MEPVDKLIDELSEASKDRFASEHAILSFSQFLELLVEEPYLHTRNSAQYTADMMDSFGSYEVSGPGEPRTRFRVFDDVAGEGEFLAVGQEDVQNAIYQCLREFVQRRQIDKLMLLHGPNGSSKTTIVNALVRGLEDYSRRPEGMLLRFNWIFSEGDDRGERLGFDAVHPDERLDTFAFLEPDRVSAKILCEFNENPVFLIPPEHRRQILREALESAPEAERERFVETRFILDGDLSPKSRTIYQSLLKAYHGDWKKVMRHVQVERYYVSKRYRTAAVTIEPQANVDAHSRQIGHSNMNGLPPVLMNSSLFEAAGDLVDANRGIVEYSDFFKRPIEANKYLLTTAENGTINLQSFTASLDVILIGTSNENYLSAFRMDPLFSSFKARFELIRVPYLLEYSKEEQIYRQQIERLPTGIRIAPHTIRLVAMWAVLTRLDRPRSEEGMNPNLEAVVAKLTPIEKAKLYDRGEVPVQLSDEEKSLLRAHTPEMIGENDTKRAEFDGLWDAAYEGRRGCSPREMLTMLSEMAIDPPGHCLTPLLVFRALPELIKEPTLYQFLRLERDNGYHDCTALIDDLKLEFLMLLREDIQVSAELVEAGEYARLFERYFANVKADQTKEKVEDENTGEFVEPDRELMKRVESLLEIEQPAAEFRSGLMTKVAARKLADPDRDFVHEETFGDLLTRLRSSSFREQATKIKRLVEDSLSLHGALPGKVDGERHRAASRFLDRMKSEREYCEYSLVEALEHFYRHFDELL